ncbi:hypothetical protein M3Y94_00367300 [Aphelenchoides besseyi]|nr:hypothetical protein M3Y94_00367300 [Aphelenchoides besseyi]KAI6235207.1 hypothetical protein M3Y95_00027100 [Aphelenchoides besseyi]
MQVSQAKLRNPGFDPSSPFKSLQRHATAISSPTVPFAKPRPVPQFPPTPSTIIKPPRFYSNQSLIVPRSKPNVSKDRVEAKPDDASCICERDEGIVICQKCGCELLGRVQQKCEAHPRKMCLMDHRECANAACRSIHLVEVSLDEEL